MGPLASVGNAHSSDGTVTVLDSHTAGEPTRLVLEGGPALRNGSVHAQLEQLRTEFPAFRTSIIHEPRGSSVLVGGLLCTPQDPASAAAVIFFNDVGYLGMCGHGTIGLVHSLAHLGRIGPGDHIIETPVGNVQATLHLDGSVTVASVPAWLFAKDVSLDVAGHEPVTGDIAWGGNWFFLVSTPPPVPLELACVAELTRLSTAVRTGLATAGITGASATPVDHIEWFSAPRDALNHSRNFVLCPGTAYDRSPCGTGTSAKLAVLASRGLLAPGQAWRQEGILGTVFTGSYTPGPPTSAGIATVLPRITGRAWVTGQTKLLFEPGDPFPAGIEGTGG